VISTAAFDNPNSMEARIARGEIESALDDVAWPWSLRLSRWIDALSVLEEAQ
jgi:hypothetical protein